MVEGGTFQEELLETFGTGGIFKLVCNAFWGNKNFRDKGPLPLEFSIQGEGPVITFGILDTNEEDTPDQWDEDYSLSWEDWDLVEEDLEGALRIR